MPQLVNQICKNPQRAKDQSSATAIICSQLCTTEPLFCYTCSFIPGQCLRRFDEVEIDPPVPQLKPEYLGWCHSLDQLQKLMLSSEGMRHICLYVPFIIQYTKLCLKKKNRDTKRQGHHCTQLQLYKLGIKFRCLLTYYG